MLKKQNFVLTFILIILILVVIFIKNSNYIKSDVSQDKIVTPSPNISYPNQSKCHAIQIDANDPQSYIPDKNCTPGSLNQFVNQSNINSTICIAGYTKTVRPSVKYTNSLKRDQLKLYGFNDQNLKDYEEDHFIPLELGENPSDPRNLWPEPHPSTNEKDKVEDYLHKLVCSGSITLANAQSEIINNWYKVYLNLPSSN